MELYLPSPIHVDSVVPLPLPLHTFCLNPIDAALRSACINVNLNKEAARSSDTMISCHVTA
jgi:hypothetical protein